MAFFRIGGLTAPEIFPFFRSLPFLFALFRPFGLWYTEKNGRIRQLPSKKEKSHEKAPPSPAFAHDQTG
jgi:hypothetical protein